MKSRIVAAVAATLLLASPQLAHAQSMDIMTVIADIGGDEYMRDAGDADSASGLRVVRLSSLAAAQRSAPRLAKVVERERRAVRYLQRNLAANWAAMHSIRYSGVGLDQIVSIHLNGDGGGVIYADDL